MDRGTDEQTNRRTDEHIENGQAYCLLTVLDNNLHITLNQTKKLHNICYHSVSKRK